MMIYFDLLKVVFRLTKNNHEDERTDWDRGASAIFYPLGDASDLKSAKKLHLLFKNQTSDTDRRDLHKKKTNIQDTPLCSNTFCSKMNSFLWS